MKKFIQTLFLFFIITACDEVSEQLPPQGISTSSVTDVTPTTANSGGAITNEGSTAVTARGIVWDTSPNPTIALSTKTMEVSNNLQFISSLADLSPSTTYFVKAYAANSVGITYGNEQSFTTLPAPAPPQVSTTSVTNITPASANSGGLISSEGTTALTSKGIVWSTSPNPTIAIATKTIETTSELQFNSLLTGLNPATTYYVKAYATNSVGTAYGTEQVFTTLPAPAPSVYVAVQAQGGINSALYWKDNQSFNLSTNGRNAFAKSIYVNQNGVYVAGEQHSATSIYVAKYWKDGVEVSLSDGVKHAFASSIFVVNTKVYVAGSQETSQQRHAKYWVDGIETILTDGEKHAIATSIYVYNNDVYVAGYMNEPMETARYWKNGVETILPTSTNSVRSRAESIYVNGGDIYIAGYQQISLGGPNAKYVATVWKNGVVTLLSDIANNGYASGVTVKDNDVYVCGHETNVQGNLVAKYWKNGLAIGLSNGATSEQTTSIFISDSKDVFVSGHSGGSVGAKYWKNGVEHANNNGTYAWGIFVY
jgi:hypothetical protein